MSKIFATAIALMIGVGFVPGIQSTLSGITVVAGYGVATVAMAGVVLVIYLWSLVKSGLE